MVRPLDEVIKSFAKLRLANNWQGDPFTDLILPNTDPVMSPVNAVEFAKFVGGDEFLFVSYRSLIEKPDFVISSIYEHCGMEKYNHKFSSVGHKSKEDDSVYGLDGMHDVRDEISIRENEVVLPENIQKICDEMNSRMFNGLNFI
jgi:hypothetical protein